MGTPFVRGPFVYWKMRAYRNVTQRSGRGRGRDRARQKTFSVIGYIVG